MKDRLRNPEHDATYVVHLEAIDFLDFAEGIYVDLVVDLGNDGLGFPGGVAKDKFAASGQFPLGGKPAYPGIQVLGNLRLGVWFDDHVSPADVDLVLEQDGDGLWEEGILAVLGAR